MIKLISTLFVAAMTVSAAQAAEASLQIDLGATTDFERRIVHYDCTGETPMSVTYINAAPNFLALMPVPDQTETLVFASVMSDVGTHYVSGQWVWSNEGTDATLSDATLGADAQPVLTCAEIINTP